MTIRHNLIILGAAASAALSLAACQSDYGQASTAADRPLNRDCRPGDTAAGTRSGEACTPGSSTASGRSDANVEGAASAGSAPAAPNP